MTHHQYLHIENLNNVEVEGILDGICYIFPKLDGTNGSVWSNGNGNILFAGSRKRELSTEHDNAGFKQWVIDNKLLRNFFNIHKDRYRLFGEWLVPHNLKTYMAAAWRKFYIFDVYDQKYHKYLSYPDFISRFAHFKLSVIPCMGTALYSTHDYLMEFVNSNDYLVQPGCGLGEGIVIKNYDFINRYGRFTYAKIIRDECKQQRGKVKAKNKLRKDHVEHLIVDKHITSMVCNKAYAKIVNETDSWSNKYISRLLNTIFHDLVTEETWDVLKKFKNPTIDFRLLQKLCNEKIKELKPKLFQHANVKRLGEDSGWG
jgi:hypothetical protein